MAVTGILIVVALILALQIDRIFPESPPSGISTDADPAAGRTHELNALEGSVATLKDMLESLHSAARKTESEAEIMAQIARLEERVMRLSTHSPARPEPNMSESKLAETRAKAVEILRLRDEIARCEKDITSLTEAANQATPDMQNLEIKVKALEAALAEAKLKNRGVRLVRELSDTTKEPVIVDVSKDGLRIMRFDQPGSIEAGTLKDFYQAIRRFRKQDQYFVLYFRPDGAGRFDEIRQAVKNAGFEVGYDAIPQNAQLSLEVEGGP